MLIEKNIKKYIIFSEDSIANALKKINANKKRFIITVSVNGIVEGVVTDGDFRRWVVSQKEIDLQKPVFQIHNPNFVCATTKDSNETISSLFTHKIDTIPLLDQSNRLRAVAFRDSIGIKIGSHIIAENSPVFIIAEIGNNHNGNIKLAKKLVDHAIQAGADCAKFQLRDMKTLYRTDRTADENKEDLGAQYTLDLLEKNQLSDDDMFSVFDYCHRKKITPLCTPWDSVSLKKLQKYGMEAYKVASADLTNHQFLKEIIETHKPIICSTGMSSEAEIKSSIQLFRSANAPFIMLHCNSTYPTPFKDVNIIYMDRLRELGADIVGYSGHERGFNIPIAAVARGAKVIEKHLTTDKTMEGNDHKISLLPDEFKTMVQGIRQIEQGLGGGKKRSISQGELINREVLGKSLMINCVLKKGYVITREMIDIKSPGSGLAPYHFDELVGTKAKRDLKPGDVFYASDISNESVLSRKYSFKRPFGIPVRYHDYPTLSSLSNFDLVEFHLSYRDMDLDPDHFFSGPQKIQFLVHSPELFKGDHVMDLAADDKSYREHSIDELQRVVKITKSLNQYFPETLSPKIIINAGGFSNEKMISADKKPELYDRVAQSLKEVDADGVEIIIQTMPPFPWHFGGQRFHNLFLDPFEIKQFCEKWSMRVCLDISHSMLACNYFKWSFERFVKLVGPLSGHIHVVDAKGIDGEGLQIGDGEIDFPRIGQLLNQHAKGIGFIPEIWQGHKNNGEGFWIALDKLEKHFQTQQDDMLFIHEDKK